MPTASNRKRWLDIGATVNGVKIEIGDGANKMALTNEECTLMWNIMKLDKEGFCPPYSTPLIPTEYTNVNPNNRRS